jgi:hypothetical protein
MIKGENLVNLAASQRSAIIPAEFSLAAQQ